MKAILILCAVILVGGAALAYRHWKLPDRFGAFEAAPKAAVADVIKQPKAYLKKTVALEGMVRKQCETMGCYFFFQEGDLTLRVDLQDIAMNAPRRNGHKVRVEGRTVPFEDGYQFIASAVEFL